MQGSSATTESIPALSSVSVDWSHFCTPAVAAVIDLLTLSAAGANFATESATASKAPPFVDRKLDTFAPWQTG